MVNYITSVFYGRTLCVGISNFSEEMASERSDAAEEIVSGYERKIDEMRQIIYEREKQIKQMTIDMQDIRMIASISESTKQEAIDKLTHRHNEDIESLRKAMEDSNQEAKMQMIKEFEKERQYWNMEIPKMKGIQKLETKRPSQGSMSDCRKNEEHVANKNETAEASNASSKPCPVSTNTDSNEFCNSNFDGNLGHIASDAPVHEVMSSSLQDENVLHRKSESSITSTDETLSGMTPKSKAECVDNLNSICETNHQRIVSEEEWNAMITEMETLREKVAAQSLSTPKQRHANLFDDDEEMSAQIVNLKEKIKVLEKRDWEICRKNRSLQESIMHSGEAAQERFNTMFDKWTDFGRLLQDLKEEQKRCRAQNVNELMQLKKQNQKYKDALCSFKKERERLLEIQEKHRQTLMKESIPTAVEPLRLMFISCRKSLCNALSERDSVSTKLQSELHFMEERLKAEQSSRMQMESSLASELHDARGEIVSLTTVKSELDKSQKKQLELEEELRKSYASFQALKLKSSEIVEGLRKKQLAETKAREEAEHALADTKHKLKSLHGALETSEQVQRDFVRLSQSLQVELEQVKQERDMERKSDAGSVDSPEAAVKID